MFFPSAMVVLFALTESQAAMKFRSSMGSRLPPYSLVTARTPKSLSVFSVVRFLNAPCSAASGGQTGICYSFNDCLRLQGTQIGTCASGFGVCCIFQRTCGTVTNQNCTYFTNPGFPEELTDSTERTCTLMLLRQSRFPVCQVKLDFVEFDLARPVDGTCETDRFTVTGQNGNVVVPELCGLNAGQHMYLDVDNSVTPVTLSITTRGEGARKWNIKVMLIECSSASRAPQNCLQYFTGPSGRFSSFNFIPDQPSVQSGGYLNNLNYAICFRKELGYCTQTYTVRSSPDGTDFAILNLDEQNNAPTVGSGQAGLGVIECPQDYVRLAGDRYCGTRLNPSTSQSSPTVNAPVTDNTTGPFTAQFVSNSQDNAVGFSLDYNQNFCENQARRYHK